MPSYPAIRAPDRFGHCDERSSCPGWNAIADRVLLDCRSGCHRYPRRGARHVPTPGDISQALSSQPGGLHVIARPHGRSDAQVICLPAATACSGRGRISYRSHRHLRTQARAYTSTVAIMMVVFFQAARLAMVDLIPISRPGPWLKTLEQSPQGGLIVDHHYYWFSSVFFYTDRTALAPEWEIQQSGLWILCSRRPKCFSR